MLQAFVDFDSGAEAERAITTKDRQVFAQKFGDRYVRLVQACLTIQHSCLWHFVHYCINYTACNASVAHRLSFASGLFVPVVVLHDM